MVRKVTLDDIENVRSRKESRLKYKPFMFLADGDTKEIEIAEDTFSFVEEGEEGLDGREVNWNQYQIMAIDTNDNIKKTFKPSEDCVNIMWATAKSQKRDPMQLKGIVFRITRDKYEYDVEIIEGHANVTEDPDEEEVSSSTEEEIRKAVKSVLESKKTEKVTSKELRQWVVAYLDDLGIEADLETIMDIIDEEKE